MSTTEKLIDLLRARHAAGLAKYGTTVDRTDLTADQWAQHAIEEMLDGAAYLMRLREESLRLRERVKRLEEAGDALQSAVVGAEGMTHWQWLAAAHEADLEWRKAKEAKP